ncbi:hypothetical protein WJX74_003638 [Apatococcus lobatus]|uniref:Peptidylprolyl isomerase n=1 Tax=Apatococcus lobatus TaxID=904363 RepID=A0AAW1QIT1_9CHLO
MWRQCPHKSEAHKLLAPTRTPRFSGSRPVRSYSRGATKQQPEVTRCQVCQASSSSQPTSKQAAQRRDLKTQATKSKGFGGAATVDLLQIHVSCKETLREGDKVHVEVSLKPEETLKAWNSVASKTQRRTPEDAHRRRGIADRSQEAGLKEKAIQKLMLAALPKATKPYEAKVLQESLGIAESAKVMAGRFQPYQPFSFTVVMKLAPEVKWLTPYTSLQVTVPYLVDEEVNKKNAAAKMKELQRRSGKLRVVTDRTCEKGDVAILRLQQVSRPQTAAEAVEDKTAAGHTTNASPLGGRPIDVDEWTDQAENIRVDTDLPEQWTASGVGHAYAPEILEGVMGMKPQQRRSLKVYREPRTGQWWVLAMNMLELFSWDLPEMTDEWAKGLQGGWASDTVQALETKALQITEAEAGQDAAQATFVAIAQAVAAAVEVEVPEAMIEEVGRMEFQKQATQYVLEEKIPRASLEKMVTESAVNQFIEQQRPQIVELVKKEMGIQEIYDRERIEVTEQEILAEMTATAEQFEGMNETFDPQKLREQIIETLKGIKTLAWLEEHNDIKYEAPPPPIQPALLDGFVGPQELAEYKMEPEFYVPTATVTGPSK